LCIDRESRGQFGDQFGVINSLFSGLAFAVIFCSLHAQREAEKEQGKRFEKQLREQKEQLERELEEQRDQFEKQAELSAMATYAEIACELWQHNERISDSRSPSAKQRHGEMLVVYKALEKRLQERGVLPNKNEH
jgi:hypothetical protein